MKKISIFLLFIVCSFLLGAQNKNIVILHTNDTHSRIEPLPENDKYNPNTGGVERRLAYIENIRKVNKNVLLFDAGDFVQGTPYFNLFKGKAEVEAMNLMHYDAGTIGNHEFDYGMDVLESFVKEITFPIVCSNYDFSKTALAPYVKPYLIVKKDGVKIGVVSTNINPRGLVASANCKGMKFLPPIETANRYALFLRSVEKCDMIVCLSHRGYENDVQFAKKSANIDIIIGGHSHTFMKKTDFIKNKKGKEVLMFQAGAKGIFVGRIDVELQSKQN